MNLAIFPLKMKSTVQACIDKKVVKPSQGIFLIRCLVVYIKILLHVLLILFRWQMKFTVLKYLNTQFAV